MEKVSVEDVMKAVSDSKSLDIFRSIAKGSIESEVLKDTKRLSKKQYYFRMKQLMNAGVVQRHKGRFSLTCLGAVVSHAQTIIEAWSQELLEIKGD
jgi:DNA-binding HxlR family transcriptional regulator